MGLPAYLNLPVMLVLEFLNALNRREFHPNTMQRSSQSSRHLSHLHHWGGRPWSIQDYWYTQAKPQSYSEKYNSHEGDDGTTNLQEIQSLCGRYGSKCWHQGGISHTPVQGIMTRQKSNEDNIVAGNESVSTQSAIFTTWQVGEKQSTLWSIQGQLLQ